MEVYCGKCGASQKDEYAPSYWGFVLFSEYGWQVKELNGFNNVCPRCNAEILLQPNF